MPKILNPKDVTGTTRFNFDFKLSNSVLLQLYKEFGDDYPIATQTPSSIKLINTKDKKAMEISFEFISFSPVLAKEEAERVRKRIYKHIAKKSEVYYSTSKESLELSISSLLADDIRSCASLLYYALHKYINGSMYSFLNNQFDLEDYKIGLAEVEHFTSSNFHKFTKVKNQDSVEINRENYSQKLCIRSNSANPFLLIQHVIKGDLRELEICLMPCTEYISRSLFDKSYSDPQLGPYLKNLVAKFNEKSKGKKKVRQEEEVKASLAFAIEKSLTEESSKVFWLLCVLSLRLYWLRQTADYEFDFEVKTSVREMSILLSSVKSFLDKQVGFEKNKQIDEQKTKLEDPINEKNKAEEQELDEKEYEVALKSTTRNNKKYSIDISFPSEINIDHDVSVFLTALHLDFEFNKEQIILILNLNEHITNQEKYFIFDSKNILAPHLYVYINDEGRWTAWFKANDSKNFITPSGLMEVFYKFLECLKTGYEKVYGNEYSSLLIYSAPINIKQQDILNVNSIINVNTTLKTQKRKILGLVTSRLREVLDTPKKNAVCIKINDFIIEFKLVFNTSRFLDIVPFDTMFFNKVVKEPENKMIINIVVGNYEKEKVEKLLVNSNRAYFNLIKKFNMDGSIDGFMPIHTTPDELEALLTNSEMNQNVLLEKIIGCISDVIYRRIVDGKTEGIEEIIDKYSKFPSLAPYAFANKGLLYLRNEFLDVGESEEQGKGYYEKAISLEHDKKEEYIKSLKQKYFYEMARFCFKRKIDLEKATEYIGKALDFGEKERFYQASLELNDEIVNAISQEEVATTHISTNKENIDEMPTVLPTFPNENLLTGDGRITIVSDEDLNDGDPSVEYIIDKGASLLHITVQLESFVRNQEVYLYIDGNFAEKHLFIDNEERKVILNNEKLILGKRVISAVQFENKEATGKLLNYAEAKFEIKEVE
ncbi:hypothetical protein COE18_03990 [Bacillus cereus]|nr:hypothetical protein COE18_03990 [Bacillus cereus]